MKSVGCFVCGFFDAVVENGGVFGIGGVDLRAEVSEVVGYWYGGVDAGPNVIVHPFAGGWSG